MRWACLGAVCVLVVFILLLGLGVMPAFASAASWHPMQPSEMVPWVVGSNNAYVFDARVRNVRVAGTSVPTVGVWKSGGDDGIAVVNTHYDRYVDRFVTVSLQDKIQSVVMTAPAVAGEYKGYYIAYSREYKTPPQVGKDSFNYLAYMPSIDYRPVLMDNGLIFPYASEMFRRPYQGIWQSPNNTAWGYTLSGVEKFLDDPTGDGQPEVVANNVGVSDLEAWRRPDMASQYVQVLLLMRRDSVDTVSYKFGSRVTIYLAGGGVMGARKTIVQPVYSGSGNIQNPKVTFGTMTQGAIAGWDADGVPNAPGLVEINGYAATVQQYTNDATEVGVLWKDIDNLNGDSFGDPDFGGGEAAPDGGDVPVSEPDTVTINSSDTAGVVNDAANNPNKLLGDIQAKVRAPITAIASKVFWFVPYFSNDHSGW